MDKSSIPLAHLQTLKARGKPAGAAPAEVVDPVIAVGRDVQLAQQRNTVPAGARMLTAR